MNRLRPSERFRPWISLYVTVIATATALIGIKQMRERNIWSMGDWLVNYQGGFVRRGLPGEAAFRLGQLMHVSPDVFVLIMQLACYAAMFYSFYRLLIGLRLKLWMILVLVSPATLAFQLEEYPSGFRKETILLAGLGLLILVLLRGSIRDAWISAYTTVFVAICILSHDAPILYGGLVLAALAIEFGLSRRLLNVLMCPLICMFCMLALTLTHHGDSNTTRRICASLGYNVEERILPAPCRGEIAQIGLTLQEERAEARYEHPLWHYNRRYLVCTLLASVPLIMAFAALWRWKAGRPLLKILLSMIALTSCAIGVLLYMTIDWGRWIYIGVFAIALLLMMIENIRQSDPSEREADERQRASRTQVWQTNIATVLFVAFYSLSWHLPHSRPNDFRFAGYTVRDYTSLALSDLRPSHFWRRAHR
ncbi:hypothetical protein RBB79_14930 [Tunturiibacter empetritectus]|uniref:Uncharacterized protein n=2 Tax=Tunturiibacter TaxID=3154218 RepID=A0A852VI90_9BACT|nr:hypothetical protein [Edaphobacter lichenicola]NYF90911.1 hypothetical protein [Edaphobacter lichenicola]